MQQYICVKWRLCIVPQVENSAESTYMHLGEHILKVSFIKISIFSYLYKEPELRTSMYVKRVGTTSRENLSSAEFPTSF